MLEKGKNYIFMDLKSKKPTRRVEYLLPFTDTWLCFVFNAEEQKSYCTHTHGHKVQSIACRCGLTTLKDLYKVLQQAPGNSSCSKSHIINFWSNWGYFLNGWNPTPYFQPLVFFSFLEGVTDSVNATSLWFLFVASQFSCLKCVDEICIERKSTKTIKSIAVWSGRMAGWEKRM